MDSQITKQHGADSGGAVGSTAWLGRIICGDNVEVMSEWPDAAIDLMVTSPPYDGIRIYGGYKLNFQNTAREMIRVLKPGGVIVWVVADQVVNGSETGSSMRQALWFMDNGMNLHDTMIYQKTGMPFPEATRYNPMWEYMFVLSKGKPKTVNLLRDKPNKYSGDKVAREHGLRQKDGTIQENSAWRNNKEKAIAEYGVRDNIWKYKTGRGNTTEDGYAFEHPAMFPESLAKDHILSWSNPGDVVCDPFNGSGTTTKAAKELNRQYVGVDVSPSYCRIAEARLLQDVLALEQCNALAMRPNTVLGHTGAKTISTTK